jgi:hypothetical protein
MHVGFAVELHVTLVQPAIGVHAPHVRSAVALHAAVW